MEIKKRKVCIIAPSLSMGGNERHLSILANYFQNIDGIQVHFIAVYNLKKFFHLNPDIKFYEPSYKRKETSKIFYNINAFMFVRKTIKQIKPDVILSFGEHLNSYLLLALLFTKFPHVISDTGSPILKNPLVIEIMKRILYPRASGIIAQTSIAAEQKKKVFGKGINISIIPNPARKINKYPEINRENNIVYIGRLHKEKGIDHLIDIFNDIPKKNNWKLLIAGTGIHEAYFKEKVENLGLEENIKFLGNIENVDLLLAKCKIFAFTSFAEGFPNSILEALCAGVPVISYDCIAGPNEMIIDGINGYLVKLGNKKVYTERLITLMNNEDKRNTMGIEAENIYKKYDLNIVGKQYLEFLLKTARRNIDD